MEIGSTARKAGTVGKLTKRTIDGLMPRERDYTVWDSELRGFGCRVHPRGRKTFLFFYRSGSGGRGAVQRKMKLGIYSEAFTVDQARTMAKGIGADVLKGRDPAGDRAAHRVAITLEDFSKLYMNDHAKALKKPRSAFQDQWMLDKYVLPKLGKRKVVDLSTGELTRFLRGHSATPILANRIRALLSKMMGLAATWDVRRDPVNPVSAVEKFPEKSRERFLLTDEIKRLGEILTAAEAAASEPWQAIAAIRLLLLTGCRRGEILTLQWSFIDTEQELILLPDSKTGRKTLYLTRQVANLLAGLPRVEACPFVLPPRFGCEGHFVGIGHVWERLRKKAGLEDVRLHDLRHTFASKGAGLGVGLPLLGALLGHANATTTARYAHLAADPTRRAGARITRRLHAELGLSDKVVAFPAGRQATPEISAVASDQQERVARKS